jgi:hypothetical protein
MSNRLGGFIAGQNINASIGTFTIGASPDLTFGSAAGTPAVGTPVQFTTTGTLPTGFSLNTTYYVRSVSSNTCQVSTTQGGSATTYTNGTGSGTHTAVTQRAFNPYAGAPDAVEYLVVAGGGGGGSRVAGGGGAGGLRTAAGFAVVSGSGITVTVGAGGAGADNYNGSNGSDSVFSSITSLGGGGGASTIGGNGATGGSGGGGSAAPNAPGLGTPPQGNAGGQGSNTLVSGGGGGGAGAVGNATNAGGRGGAGGTGLCSTITGSRIFYAGGGGGGGYSDQPGTAGGKGGAGGGADGGIGIATPNLAPGTANTGGGGGGNGFSGNFGPGSAGGSGIVIVRYPQVNSAPAMVTGSPQVSYADGYQIYTWTSSGSIIF